MGRRFQAVFVAFMTASALFVGTSAAPVEPVGTQSYIVVLQDGAGNVPAIAADLARAHGGQVGFVYEHAIQGFSVTISPQGAAALARNPRVAYVETNDPVSIAGQTIPTGVERIFADANASIDIDGTDDFRVDVDVAVIDTGVDFEHPDLNVVRGVTCAESGGGPPWARTASCTSGGDDDHYHGTHVAGTIAAIDNGNGVVGVAPGARIWAVKVLSSSGSGSEAMVVAGIDWVAANAIDIEVANMSLGGAGFSRAEYDAIQGAVNKGVAFAVAAGNSDADANDYSPAAFDNVLTVSALADFDGIPGALGSPTCRTDQDDTLADFSNWGSAVDIAAPGVCILSTYPIERGGYGTISGTSMASPHAAGALALLASSNTPNNSTEVYNLYRQVIDAGNFNWADDSGDRILEPLLDVTGFSAALTTGSGDGGGVTDNPPAVSILSPSDGAIVSGSVAVSADADDDTAVEQVEFFVDGASIGFDADGTDGWTSLWDSNGHSEGGHELRAVATDSAGQESAHFITVTVDNIQDPEASIALSATAYKVKGVQHADLTWSGATSIDVDVHRNGEILVTTVNDGTHTDSTGQKGGGSATYQVCEAGTSTCSNTVTVSW